MRSGRHGEPLSAKNGFTMLEAVIAMGILSVLSLALISTTTLANRMTSNLPNTLFASLTLNLYAEDLRREIYDNIGKFYSDGTPLLAKYATPQDIVMDPDNPNKGPTFTVTTVFKGFGGPGFGGGARGYAMNVASGTLTSLTVSRPAGTPAWETDEWQGYIVSLNHGNGRSQVAVVTSNDGSTLQLDGNIRRDDPGEALLVAPDSNTYFEIGTGKSAEITVSWRHQERNFEQSIRILLFGC